MKNKSNAEKTRKLGDLVLLTGSGVINYNPCDHWMSPLFLKCSTDTIYLAVTKPADQAESGEYARTQVAMVPTLISSPTHVDTHTPLVREQTGEPGNSRSHTLREKHSWNTVSTKFAWCLLDAQ